MMLSWIPFVNDSDALVRIWELNRSKWMWGRIWMRTGKMGIILRARVLRGATLGLDQKWRQYQILRLYRPRCRIRTFPCRGISIWSPPSTKRARRLKPQGQAGPSLTT